MSILGIRDSGERIVTNGLVLYYDAAQFRSYTSGSTTWNDISGQANNGTLTNGPTFNSDNGGSIVFDYINDNVISANSITMNPLNGYTMASWFYPTFTQADFDAAQIGANVGGLFNPTDNSYAAYTAVAHGFNGVGAFRTFAFMFDSQNDSRNAPSINYWNVNTWGYLASGQFGNTVKIWFNGTNILNVTNFTRTYSRTSRFSISDNSNAGGVFYGFRGRVATTSYYNRLLSDAEVLQNYNAQRVRFGL
jgi:hypothetical protein